MTTKDYIIIFMVADRYNCVLLLEVVKTMCQLIGTISSFASHFISGVKMRSPVSGEIKPVSVTQSSTRFNREISYGAHFAIDGDLDTQSYTDHQSDPWFKATLDREYCIATVVQIYDNNNQYDNHITYTCSQDRCSCEGRSWQCEKYSLSVYREDGTVPGPDVPSGCKLGDTVKIERADRFNFLYVHELVIIPRTVGRLRR